MHVKLPCIFFIFSALLLAAGCTNPRSSAASTEVGAPPAAGVLTAASNSALDSSAFPAVFEAAFWPGTRARQDSVAYTFAVAELGKLSLQSGKVVAGDPVALTAKVAFKQRFPTGEFPVQLALARTPTDERVALARVLFSRHRVVRWQLALLPGQLPLALTDKQVYCYGVDSGLGVFADAAAIQPLQLRNPAVWDSVFSRPGRQPGSQGYLYRAGRYSLATFTTGYGDGCYATYCGFDAAGNVCRLLTDFNLVEW